MIKKIVFRTLIILSIASLLYGVFWFFKVGQAEKELNKFIVENSANISAGEISISGFPFSQKIKISDLRFRIPSSALNKKEIIISEITAHTQILSSKFTISFPNNSVKLKDAQNNFYDVEFAKDPEISIAINDSYIESLNYEDLGYRILDDKKNVIYAAKSSNISVESKGDKSGVINSKISINIKEIENLDIVGLYNNATEEKVINALKTGQITFSSQRYKEDSNIVNIETNVEIENAAEVNLAKTELDVEAKTSKENAAKDEEIDEKKVQITQNNIQKNPENLDENHEVKSKQDLPKKPEINQEVSDKKIEESKTKSLANIPADDKNKKIAEVKKVENKEKEALAKNLKTNSKETNSKPEIKNSEAETKKVSEIENSKTESGTKTETKVDLSNESETESSSENPSLNSVENQEDKIEEDMSLENKEMAIEVTAENPSLLKSNFSAEITINFIPSGLNSRSNSLEDPLTIPTISASEIQDLHQQYNKIVKISKLQITNPLYEILISGDVEIYNDDNKPSGQINIEIRNIDILADYFVKGFEKILGHNKNKTNEQNIAGVLSSDLTSDGSSVDKTYEEFLIRITSGLQRVLSEISAKNENSKDNISVFNIERQKNLEFQINNTSMREVRGKF
jgi:hypothetical protein